MQPNTRTLISSSGGRNASGEHVVSAVSVLSYVCEGSDQVHTARAVDNVSFMSNPVWSKQMLNVSLPTQRIFENVSLAPALIRHWLRPDSLSLGGLVFPRSPLETESLVPIMHILKSGIGSQSAPALSIKADLTLSIFWREMKSDSALQPFDPAVWHPTAYGVWRHFYYEFAPMFEEECNATCHAQLPGRVSSLFRGMMHTHYEDFGLIFGTMWFKFGLGEMISTGMHDFMREMLSGMFVRYNLAPVPPASPPLFNAVIRDSGQRICAGCMSSRLGTGQMMRCPCHQVYYCSKACQLANWKVHRLVCGQRGKPA